MAMAAAPGTVPLGVLLRREVTKERMERPDVLCGEASRSRKGEDFTLLLPDAGQRVAGDPSTSFSVFALFDGHNGSGAAIYAKENLLNNVLRAIPTCLSREEWLAVLPRALVAAFVKTDKDFQAVAETSGTTVTFVIIDEWVVTVASVGDSRCILESADGSFYYLSADHRFDSNPDEVQRITACGSKVGKMDIVGGPEVGPLRCWPGGLCLSRSIGDLDVGECVIAVPHVKQVKLSNAGGRIIIASDGVWDDLTCEMALDCSRGFSSDVAANRIVNEAIRPRGIRDDTTCIVIDVLPPEKLAPSPPKKQGKIAFNNMFRRKSLDVPFKTDGEYAEPDVVEEIFEDGSAMLSKRLTTGYALQKIFAPSSCAVCLVGLKSGQGISVHANPLQYEKLQGWQGPFLCQSCHEKKEAMEGKWRPGGVTN
ncbi:probable protein phosphatase 2C 69 [Phragmites australis]|uniref:probable protein phosphatase 2C 69 n=1 Tax=Phragmites australis TaxID=29695 RepID=UPI002D79EA97|nr:probable protein phosphatase 2C 69 [Phragmites australis]XP_062199986.1 probable protein phosphatase 2C 69 [Phragmites australis]